MSITLNTRMAIAFLLLLAPATVYSTPLHASSASAVSVRWATEGPGWGFSFKDEFLEPLS